MAQERKLATLEQISSIAPIEGAYAIESAKVRGWTVVVRKGSVQVGDEVVYLEIDTALPLDDPRFEDLRPRGCKTIGGQDYHVLKTARLRGVYSQGMIVPASEVPEACGAKVGDDLTEALGLFKYEPPLPAGGAGKQVGPFITSLAPKTDSERVQNLQASWEEVRSYAWIATEKVDGSSLTVGRDLEGNLRVCSRNWEIREGENIYWRAARLSGLDGDWLKPGMVVQGEIVGPGVQGNPLKLEEVQVLVFDLIESGAVVPRDQWPEQLLGKAVPVLDIKIPDAIEDLVSVVDGMRSSVNPKVKAEGVVFHTAGGEIVPSLGRSTFKVISNKYLLKHS